ncbi:2-dehydropantoate 2-reductase N-terminal domain-containing protein [Streptomyces niveiscabiei]|uniref:ketopantoate reductase family protein n=1 Tax=Streptomyces niveiscabiei TaxID=164115 RepID=UPI0029BF4AD3|nr:2-dehydropantoate 2-reductase N-terminal domain-containing protein [Streptomyces niveiscabiei]MDX3388286.1 2-dehydropantoate 2-reductase N-terminal domain-containing protein [Streptomyces niveiscabiei]
MTAPSILIVGAGATGLPVGYHLSLAEADVTFLVRPGRKAPLSAAQRLYCYDDAELKTFDDYRVVDNITQLAGTSFQFVIITLDGHTSRAPEGIELLRGLGNVVRACDAHVIMCGFGLGVREHHLQALGIEEDRLTHGFLGMLSHQATADLPIHPPTDPAHVAQASICYRHPANRTGFRIETGNATAAQQFAELYERSGVSKCAQISREVDNVLSNAASPVYAAGELAGWPDFATLTRDEELWGLACRAQAEIMTLPRHGRTGQQMAKAMGPRETARAHQNIEREMLPLDYRAFNRFHHGGKVRSQDVETLHDCLAEGRRSGHAMLALEELLNRLETHHADGHSR